MPTEKPEVKACPFCAGEFNVDARDKSVIAVHPGQQGDKSCALAGFVFSGDRVELLNMRPGGTRQPDPRAAEPEQSV